MSPASARFDIVALGEAMVEFNQVPGSSPDRFLRGVGGDTSNTAIGAARLARHLLPPLRVAYVTRVGDDGFGRLLLDRWRDEGVDTSGIEVDTAAPTGVYFVSHGPNGHEFSYLRAGSAAARMVPERLPQEVIRCTRLLHVSGISQAISSSACDSVLAAIELARGNGARISYDPNLRLKLWPLARARAIIVATLGLCDLFLPSYEEACTLSGVDAPQAILDWCHRQGASIVALKCGAEGVWISDAGRTERIASHRVAAIDATGAGDCFDGAFVVRLLAGDDAFMAARYANAAAALATTGFGAVAPLPEDAAVRTLLGRSSPA